MAEGKFRDRSDFEATIDAAATDFLGVNPAVVEKDYWVTQGLRALAAGHSDDFVFKGGTSLSKGFDIIQRFSEDIDLLLLPNGRGKGALDKVMKAMGSSAGAAVGDNEPTHTNQDKGVKRRILLTYPRSRDVPWLRPTIDLEIGIRGGPNPSAVKTVETLIGVALRSRGTATDDYEDLLPFDVPTLHPGRTCIEKLALVNEQAEKCANDDSRVFQLEYGRHFYDIHMLLGDARVQDFLEDRPVFLQVVDDCQRVSREHFDSSYERPANGYAAGAAFTSEEQVMTQLRTAYESAEDLTYGPIAFPSWDEVLVRVDDSRELL